MWTVAGVCAVAAGAFTYLPPLVRRLPMPADGSEKDTGAAAAGESAATVS